ncbi:MAG: hypothetical protein KC591_08850 [Gemmatimonadetes bacterium]|nr:hypothetical protein [Gemmatimonadota bacterium]
MHRRPWIVVLVLALVVAGSSAISAFSRVGPRASDVVVSERLVATNDAFVAGLYTNLDLDDPWAVFRYVFARMHEDVMVYPSEGYYYWRFPVRGVTVRGCFMLPARTRDLGQLGFGYISCLSDPTPDPPAYGAGGALDVTAGDGLRLDRIDDWTYRARFEGKTVTFHLYDPGLVAPDRARLSADEEYVGTTFDESGLRFHLLFNRRVERLYWMLDDAGFVPEVLTLVSKDLALGERTKFVFFVDRALDRKILVGVQGDNVRWNSWYDGPFDQLPDTYVKLGRIDLRHYLAAHGGLTPDEIDEFGFYPERDGVRIAVTPYVIYNDLTDLRFVEAAADSGFSGTDLYERITREIYVEPARPRAATP